jgi:hypothetical protein
VRLVSVLGDFTDDAEQSFPESRKWYVTVAARSDQRKEDISKPETQKEFNVNSPVRSPGKERCRQLQNPEGVQQQ